MRPPRDGCGFGFEKGRLFSIMARMEKGIREMIGFDAGQTFVVAGATGGIGGATALLLNRLGADVIAVGRDAGKLEALKARAENPGAFHLERKDLAADVSGLPAYVKTLRGKYGKLRGLAYCAGVRGFAPLKAVDHEAMQRIFAINYFAPVFLAKGFADRRNNAGRGSAMVFVASRGGVVADPGMVPYAGSKGALVASMQSAAKELAPAGIRVNCISPALVDTPMADETARRYAEGRYPTGLGRPEDPAEMIAFLLSDRAGWISAQNYVMDCGMI